MKKQHNIFTPEYRRLNSDIFTASADWLGFVKAQKRATKAVEAVLRLEPACRAAAAQAYEAFCKEEIPDGRKDGGGRWQPSALERRACCDAIRQPSRTWPWSYYKHCLSLQHKTHRHSTHNEHVLHVKHLFDAWKQDATLPESWHWYRQHEENGFRDLLPSEAELQIDAPQLPTDLTENVAHIEKMHA